MNYAAQPTTPKGTTAGQVWVTVSQGGTVLWRFLVVRPAASSGTNGSGIELRFVDYRGKRVLYRAHVPILNVKYDSNACGPYLDWQWQEGMLQANGTDVAPGFRLASAPAQTILQSGNDTGNFLGVAIYVQGQEVVLVSEMQAGWYRYVSEWRLHTDGTVRPRFGFGAVQSSCVCTRHHHHVYWRLDFDIRTAGDNVVTEFNDPPLFGSSNWHTKHFEIRRLRDPSRKRKWQITNATSGDAYEITPGPDDGLATASPDWPFPQGDVWLLRYRATELEHGVLATGPPYEANLDTWVTGETIERQDVVVWYAGHVSGAFERFLLVHGERVVRVAARLTAGERRSGRDRGKSDLIDAIAVARAALREGLERLPVAELAGVELDIRLLVDHRERLVKMRVALYNDLLWHLHDLWPELTIPGCSLLYKKWATRIARRLARAEQTTRIRIARDELRHLRELSHTIDALEAEVSELVAQAAPQLLAEPGFGPLTAGKLIGEIAGASASPPTPSSPAPPASPPSPSARATPTATASTAAATARSTPPSTASPSPAPAATPRPAPTSTANAQKAKAPKKPSAASNDTSPDASGTSSKPPHPDQGTPPPINFLT